MYRNCIFCSADFGSNDMLEAFPVGRQLAFDAEKGRLWAVCGVCGRWNLAPLEERWEAVEASEKLYQDARMRVQRENIGLARLQDGTRLVRVGRPVEGELAAWRYGSQLLRRRRRYFVMGAGGAAAAAAVVGGITAMGGGLFSLLMAKGYFDRRRDRKVVYRVAGDLMTDRRPLMIRRWHLDGMSLESAAGGSDVEVLVRDGSGIRPRSHDRVRVGTKDIITVTGPTAHKLLARTMVHVNRKGATRSDLEAANSILETRGSAQAVIHEAANLGAALGERAGRARYILDGPRALAFEMALHEEAERAALAGELAGLSAAWREAEEIAAIADALPGEVLLDRLLTRLDL